MCSETRVASTSCGARTARFRTSSKIWWRKFRATILSPKWLTESTESTGTKTAECELTPEDYGNAKREKPVYKLKIVAKNMEDIRVILHKIKTGVIRPEESYEGQQQGKSCKQLETELTSTQQQLGEALEDNEGLTIALESERRATKYTEILRQSVVSEMECLNADLEQVRRELATAQETAELLGQYLSATQKQLGELASRNTRWGLMLVAVREFADEMVGDNIGGNLFYWLWPFVSKRSVAEKIRAILNDGKKKTDSKDDATVVSMT